MISKINRAISLFYPYLYTLIYVLQFLNSTFFGWQNIGGAIAPPPCPPPPCSYGHGTRSAEHSNLKVVELTTRRLSSCITKKSTSFGFPLMPNRASNYLHYICKGLSGHQGKSKRRRLLCYAGRKSPSRQLDDFEIVMLISSFIQTRRPVTPASLLLSF